MALVRINWKPDVKERRKFGVAMLVGFGLISVILYYRDHFTAALVCSLVATVVGGIGLTGTAAAMPFYWLWMAIAFVMGNIISRLILSLFYYIILTPIALVMRLAGRDRLRLKGKSETYWLPMSGKSTSYERQF